MGAVCFAQELLVCVITMLEVVLILSLKIARHQLSLEKSKNSSKHEKIKRSDPTDSGFGTSG